MKQKTKMIDDYGIEADCVKLLPINEDGNAIVSFKSYLKEMAFRRQRNRLVANPFPLPKWEDLKPYGND